MGFTKLTPPRRGCDAFGPGAIPRRAIAAAPAPWRRPLAALVLAGTIGMGAGVAPAMAAPSHTNQPQAAQEQPQGSPEQPQHQQSREPRPKRASGTSAEPTRQPRRMANDSANSTQTATASTASTQTATASTQTSTDSAATSVTSVVGDATAPLAPGTYRLSAAFGATGSWARYHTGQDFSASTGTPVYAVVSGTVVSADVGSWAGNYVAIKAADGSATLYAHLNSTEVSVGQTVTAGQQIGTVGNTGRSFGSHLHFEYYPAGVTPGDVYSATDPMSYLTSLGITM